WRSDTILGLMPIEEERGPKRRTNVFVEGRAEPIIASRTEQSILEDMGASDAGFQVPALREAVTELLAALHELSPVLRRTLQPEGWASTSGTVPAYTSGTRAPSGSPRFSAVSSRTASSGNTAVCSLGASSSRSGISP